MDNDKGNQISDQDYSLAEEFIKVRNVLELHFPTKGALLLEISIRACFVLCEQPSQSHPSKSLLYTPASLPTLANESGTEGGAPGMFCKHFRTLAMSRSFGHLHPVGRPPHGHPLWGSETKAMELRYGGRGGCPETSFSFLTTSLHNCPRRKIRKK